MLKAFIIAHLQALSCGLTAVMAVIIAAIPKARATVIGTASQAGKMSMAMWSHMVAYRHGRHGHKQYSAQN